MSYCRLKYSVTCRYRVLVSRCIVCMNKHGRGYRSYYQVYMHRKGQVYTHSICPKKPAREKLQTNEVDTISGKCLSRTSFLKSNLQWENVKNDLSCIALCDLHVAFRNVWWACFVSASDVIHGGFNDCVLTFDRPMMHTMCRHFWKMVSVYTDMRVWNTLHSSGNAPPSF